MRKALVSDDLAIGKKRFIKPLPIPPCICHEPHAAAK